MELYSILRLPFPLLVNGVGIALTIKSKREHTNLGDYFFRLSYLMQGCFWIGWIFGGSNSQWFASMLLRTAFCLPVSLLVFSAASQENSNHDKAFGQIFHFVFSSLSIASVLIIGPPFSSW